MQSPLTARESARARTGTAAGQQEQEQEQQQVGHEVQPPGASTTLNSPEQVEPIVY